MRVFFAIEFSHELKGYIKSIQDILKDNAHKGNFSREENFHLTLKFIGEVNDDEVERLKKAIDEAAEGVSSFDFRMSKIGWFRRGNRKIVWLGVDKNGDELDKLYYRLETSLSKIGYKPEERGYSPHITLAREVELNVDGEQKLKGVVIEPYCISVDAVSLMESTRIKGELTYIPIYRRELGR